MKDLPTLGHIDLANGIVPITEAAGSLAMLLKRARANHEHIVLTQKGRASGVLLTIEEYTLLRELAEKGLGVLTHEQHSSAPPADSGTS